MSYIVVQNYDKVTNACYCVLVSEDTLDIERQLGFIPLDTLGSVTMNYGYRPLNFDVDRHGNVRMSRGDFSRFRMDGCAVVIGELRTSSGTLVRLRLLSVAKGNIVNVTPAEVIERNNAQDHPFLQNGIIRDNKISCYPNSKFPVITVGTPKPQRTRQQKPIQTKQPVKKEEVMTFTPQQQVELDKCKQKLGDNKLIYNNKLSPEQMRVLWVSKSKGALSEMFNSPSYSVEVMKFYADRLVNNRMVNECWEMLQHPELTLGQLAELYLCIFDGVDYRSLIGLDESQIQVERKLHTKKLSGNFSQTDYDSAFEYARKVQGF